MIYRTAGGGGWKDPLDRPDEIVEADVAKRLVSAGKTEAEYGVIIGDSAATEVKRFDMGPGLEAILAACKEETGLEPPALQEPLAWASMESGEEALKRVREEGDRQASGTE